MIKRLGMIALILLVVNIGVLTSQVKAKAKWTWEQEKAKHYPNGVKPYWMPQIYWAIAACETPPGRWDHHSGNYQGAFGFAYTTWDRFKLKGYPAEAYQASAWQQYVVARADHDFYGNFSGWGGFTGGGYLSHMN